MTSILKCHACGRANFKNKRGLTQHQTRSASCQPGFKKRSFGKFDLDNGGQRQHGLLKTTAITRPPKRQCAQSQGARGELDDNSDQSQVMSGSDAPFMGNDDDDSSAGAANADHFGANFDNPSTKIQSKFRDYVASRERVIAFNRNESLALDLCHRLRQSKASLDTYEDVMQWHFEATGNCNPP